MSNDDDRSADRPDAPATDGPSGGPQGNGSRPQGVHAATDRAVPARELPPRLFGERGFTDAAAIATATAAPSNANLEQVATVLREPIPSGPADREGPAGVYDPASVGVADPPVVDEGRPSEEQPAAAARKPPWYRLDLLSTHQLVTRLLTLLGVAVAVVFVWLQLQPNLLLANTLPSGGDMGAHVWGPDFLRRGVLPNLRLSGWTPDWYAGFPAYHFYMVVPSLLVLAFDAVPFVSYGVAFKLATVSGLLAMPVGAWSMGRNFGLRYPGPALLAFATVPFIFDTRYTIYGGNAASTLAGEFAFSISLALVLVYLGVVAKGLETGRYRWAGAVLFALILLCHLLPAIFAVVATIVLAAWKLWPSWRSTLAWTIPVGIVGALTAGFWAVPFLLRHAYFNDMGWERTQTYFENLGPAKGATWLWYGVFALAIVGAVLSLIERCLLGGFLTSMALVTGIAFTAMPQGAFWNARVLPFYYLSLYLLAGVGVALFIGLVPSLGARSVLAAGSACGLLLVVALPLGVVPGHNKQVNGKYELFGVKVTPSFVDDWARWNYTGYERKPAYPEYKAVVDTMAALGQDNGCGRAMWEYQTEKLNSYGTPMALMLLPYWTDGCIGSMEGLYFESSATTPFHFLNQSELSEKPSSAQRKLPYRGFDIQMGVDHLQLMGVRYYMALSDVAKGAAKSNPELSYLRSSGPWDIFEVRNAELVSPLEYKPAVLEVDQHQTTWLPEATAFYNDPSRWAVPLAGSGPSTTSVPGEPCAGDGWQRVAAGQVPERCPVTPAKVSAITATNDAISFDVDIVGSPVLVKTSYFPNWKVSGGKGPYRVTPNLMVVIPTSNHVRLHYGQTPVDWAGMGLTALGIVGIVALAKLPGLTVRRRPPRPAFPDVPIDLSRYQLPFSADPYPTDPYPADQYPTAPPDGGDAAAVGTNGGWGPTGPPTTNGAPPGTTLP